MCQEMEVKFFVRFSELAFFTRDLNFTPINLIEEIEMKSNSMNSMEFEAQKAKKTKVEKYGIHRLENLL